MASPPLPGDAHPYLRASTAGIRHHARALNRAPKPVDRTHLDTLHAHLTSLHPLLDQLAETTRPPHPWAGKHLVSAHTRLWQAATEIHTAYHLLPSTAKDSTEFRPDRLPEGPPVLTICQRHLATGHIIRRKTTPADLSRPPHITACVR